MNERELLDKRNVIAQQLRTMLKEAPNGVLVGEQLANYDQMHKDMCDLEDQVKAVRDTERRAFELDEREQRIKSEPQSTPVHQRQATDERTASRFASKEYKEAFSHYLRTGQKSPELRALAADTDVAGGFTIPYEQFADEFIQAIDDEVFVRQLAKKFTLTNGQRLTFPTRASDLGDATWGTELQVATADTTLAVGQRTLTPHPMTAQILVSKLLYGVSSVDIDAFVRERFVYKYGITAEKAYMEGNGAGRPLGVFIGDANGLSTTRDVTTSASSANPTALNLIATFYTLKPQYRRNASWVLNRTWMSSIRRLQDSNNNFIWQPAGFGTAQGLTVGKPDTILGAPYYESEYAPSVATAAGSSGTGAASSGYFAAVGDFSKGYYIADREGLGVAMYDQINAATNQNTYIGLWETDGKPVLEEALVRARASTQ